MSVPALLTAGLVVLTTGMLLTLSADPATASSPQSLRVLDYLADVCALVGGGLVVASAFVRARPATPRTEPPAVDHYRS